MANTMLSIYISIPEKIKDGESLNTRMNDAKRIIKEMYTATEFEDHMTFIVGFESEEDANANRKISVLSNSIKRMAHANLIFMAHGWQYDRQCRIEHEIAVTYGVPVLYA